jgi:hypothetical protein
LDGNSLGKAVGGGIHLGNYDILVILVGGAQLVIDRGKLLAVSTLKGKIHVVATVTYPRSIKLNKNILLGIHDLVKVLSNKNSDRGIIGFGDRLRLDVGIIRSIASTGNKGLHVVNVEFSVDILVPDDEAWGSRLEGSVDGGRDNVTRGSPAGSNGNLSGSGHDKGSLVSLGNFESDGGGIGITILCEDGKQVEAGGLGTSPAFLGELVDKRESFSEDPSGDIFDVEFSVVGLDLLTCSQVRRNNMRKHKPSLWSSTVPSFFPPKRAESATWAKEKAWTFSFLATFNQVAVLSPETYARALVPEPATTPSISA